MAEVQEVAFPRSGGAYRAASSVARPGQPSTGPNLATREWIRSSPLALSEARRAWNRDRSALASDLRRECARPSCRDRVPAVAETHRMEADQFVVAPAHFDGGVVVRAADRFFVELRFTPSCSRQGKRFESRVARGGAAPVELNGTTDFLVADVESVQIERAAASSAPAEQRALVDEVVGRAVVVAAGCSLACAAARAASAPAPRRARRLRGPRAPLRRRHRRRQWTGLRPRQRHRRPAGARGRLRARAPARRRRRDRRPRRRRDRGAHHAAAPAAPSDGVDHASRRGCLLILWHIGT